MEDEFDIAEVWRLVDEALASKSERVGVQVQTGPPPLPPKGRIPLGLGDSRLLANLEPLLAARGVYQSDIQLILDELRSAMIADLSTPDLQTVHSITLACKRCPNLVQPAKLPLGNLYDPDVVIIADNVYDDWPADLVAYLKGASFDLTRVCLSFATRCKASRRQPDKTELDNCYEYLTTELSLLKPKLIIAMGGLVAEELAGTVKITEDHGKIFWTGPWAIMPVYSLGYLGRKAGAEKDFAADLLKAKGFLYG